MVGAVLALLAACTCAAPSSVPSSALAAPGAAVPDAAAPPPSAAGGVLAGLCEASTLVPWNGGWLVGDNEDTERLYAFDPDFTPRPPIPLPSVVDDIEALALRDGGYWVVGSHSTNKDGEVRPKRERLLSPTGAALPVTFEGCAPCQAARGLGPDRAGLNIEGAASWNGRLWLGLRAPLSASGKALLVALDDKGAAAETLEVDLGGLGIREAIPHGDGLLLIAGPTADADTPHALYRLDAARALTRLVTLPTSTEGIAVDPSQPNTLVYVTDGDGKPGKCKQPATWGRISTPL
ncbi:MAG: DUF3616 domain-containing protein [Pseudomonadota bacterium]|nr:DUF3616 domain-containing protein [Pseudomonadota bacterium]